MEIELPDFPWLREETWMQIEQKLRQDPERNNDEFIELTRRAFDASWVDRPNNDLDFHIELGPITFDQVGMNKLANHVGSEVAKRLHRIYLPWITDYQAKMLTEILNRELRITELERGAR